MPIQRVNPAGRRLEAESFRATVRASDPGTTACTRPRTLICC